MNVVEYYLKKVNILLEARRSRMWRASADKLNALNLVAVSNGIQNSCSVEPEGYWNSTKVRVAISSRRSMMATPPPPTTQSERHGMGEYPF